MKVKDYRRAEFNKLPKNDKYSTSIKVTRSGVGTNWFTITENELQIIIKLLTS